MNRIIVSVGLVLTSSASAQVLIGPERAVTGGGKGDTVFSNTETAITVRSNNTNHVALAWNRKDTTDPSADTNRQVLFSSSVDGAMTLSSGSLLPMPNACGITHSVDPIAVSVRGAATAARTSNPRTLPGSTTTICSFPVSPRTCATRRCRQSRSTG